MTILLFLLLIGTQFICYSQASFALRIARTDVSTIERKVHFTHHLVHFICGLLACLAILALLIGNFHSIVKAICETACAFLLIDAATFLISNKLHQFSTRRDAIWHKWQTQKVFGPEHDSEVSEFRVLKEITLKNLLRDTLHLLLFAGIYLVAYCL